MKNKKPYAWEEIEEFLVKELKKTKHIMTFGTLGSRKVEHEIDTIITKKPKSKSSDFYKEVHSLFDNLSNYLMKKYGAKAIRFSFNEKEALKLSDYNKNDLAFHTMIYTSYPQIERDWNWALLRDDIGIKKTLIKHYNCLRGDVKDLFSKEFMKEKYPDPIFIFVSLFDKMNSNYSKNFFLEVMNDHFEFLFRKKLGLKTPVAKNKKEVKEVFYKLCDKLDELDREKK